MSTNYWAVIGDSVRGPLTFEELVLKERARVISPQTMVKTGGEGARWLPWSALKHGGPEVEPVVVSAPAPPRQAPSVVAPDEDEAPLLSRGIYIGLALFLGCIGIHNFYAGHYGRAAVQIIVTVFAVGFAANDAPEASIAAAGLLGVWLLGEIAMETKDGRGRFMR